MTCRDRARRAAGRGRKLRALGFIPAGEFLAVEEEGGRIRYDGRELLPTPSGFYAFVLNVYIGVAADVRRRVVNGHCRALIPARTSMNLTISITWHGRNGSS